MWGKVVETAAHLVDERGGADGRILNSMRSAPPPPPAPSSPPVIPDSLGYRLDVSPGDVAGRTLSVNGSI